MLHHQKTGLIIVVGVVVILAAIGFALSGKKDDMGGNPMGLNPTPQSVTTVPPGPSTDNPLKADAPTTAGRTPLYMAECILPAGTIIGSVIAPSDVSDKADPADYTNFKIRNNNTGVETSVKKGDGRCSFTPIGDSAPASAAAPDVTEAPVVNAQQVPDRTAETPAAAEPVAPASAAQGVAEKAAVDAVKPAPAKPVAKAAASKTTAKKSTASTKTKQ